MARAAGVRVGPRLALPALAVLVLAAPARPQKELNFGRLGGAVRLLHTDMAVLEDMEDRTDLPCEVVHSKPEMAFDLRFHAGYEATIPLRDLAGEGNQLRVLARITPLARPERQMYLVDRFSVPPIEEGAKGEAYLPGEFTLGPGRYKVDWLLRDRSERVCSSHWELEARLSDHYENLPLALLPDTAAQRPPDPFAEAPPVQRISGDQSLHVKVLVNFSPSDPGESALKPWDVQAIVSILRSISREPQFGRFSLVAFSMHEERVIYREENATRIDFPALGEAVRAVKFGVVDYRRLQDPQSGTRFLTELLTEHLGPQQPKPDAIIIVGPKVMLDKKVPQEALREDGRADCPIFYLNYNSNPRRNPWRDAIGAALKIYKGLEYTVTFPRDLGVALSDMMLRLTRRR